MSDSPLLRTPTLPGTPGTPASFPGNSHSHSRPVRRQSTSSFSHFRLDGNDGEDEAESSASPHLKGLRHTDVTLDAMEWKDPKFKVKILDMLQALRIPLWSSSRMRPSSIHLLRVSGALTNAVFFLSYNPSTTPTEPAMSPLLTPTMPGVLDVPPTDVPTTLLLRIYGPSTGTLISRTEELRILHTLSSQYGLGPRVEGTFSNGRIEQFFPSRALHAKELRDPVISASIACRMRELHSVDLRALGYEDGTEGVPIVWNCLRDWVHFARDTLDMLKGLEGWGEWIEGFGLERIEGEVEKYKEWVNAQKGKGKGRVFCHNDTQYGNILRLDEELRPGEPEHHKLIVVDFEYAAPNPRGLDIANHFHEWLANYHSPLAHSLSSHFPGPTLSQRQHFYRSYLSLLMDSHDGHESLTDSAKVSQERVDKLEEEVRIWSPASSVFWAIWGLVQAKEMVEDLGKGKKVEDADFDYLSYALERIGMFRKEVEELGIQL